MARPMTTDEMSEMFEVGDAVYHPTNGAGIIAKLHRMPALKKGQRFYRIRMLDGAKTVLSIPVRKAGELGLRAAADRDQAEEILKILASQPVALPDQHKQRYRACEEKLDAAEMLQTAEVVRDLAWRQAQHDRLNVPGRRIYKRAMKLLAGELAIAQGISFSEAEEQIRVVLKAQTMPGQETTP
jgi:CarD family transcriptional regulator